MILSSFRNFLKIICVIYLLIYITFSAGLNILHPLLTFFSFTYLLTHWLLTSFPSRSKLLYWKKLLHIKAVFFFPLLIHKWEIISKFLILTKNHKLKQWTYNFNFMIYYYRNRFHGFHIGEPTEVLRLKCWQEKENSVYPTVFGLCSFFIYIFISVIYIILYRVMN